jgi:hypothetical protein
LYRVKRHNPAFLQRLRPETVRIAAYSERFTVKSYSFRAIFAADHRAKGCPYSSIFHPTLSFHGDWRRTLAGKCLPLVGFNGSVELDPKRPWKQKGNANWH